MIWLIRKVIEYESPFVWWFRVILAGISVLAVWVFYQAIWL